MSTVVRTETLPAVAAFTGAGAHSAGALADASPQVRAWALRAVFDGSAPHRTRWRVVAHGPLDLRLAVYRGLRREPGTGAADAVIGPVRERWGDGEAARLLSACSAATVRELLPELNGGRVRSAGSGSVRSLNRWTGGGRRP